MCNWRLLFQTTTKKKPVFKTPLESDKSVYFSSPFITAVEHPRALRTGLEGWSSSAAVALILHYGQIFRRCPYCGVTYSIFLSVSQLVGDEPLFWNTENFPKWSSCPASQVASVQHGAIVPMCDTARGRRSTNPPPLFRTIYKPCLPNSIFMRRKNILFKKKKSCFELQICPNQHLTERGEGE